VTETSAIDDLLLSLWAAPESPWFEGAIPRNLKLLTNGYERLRDVVEAAPRERAGVVEPGALVQGEIVSMGRGSRIEAGAIVHRSCRLVLGEDSLVRSGAVLRDEVVIGRGCMVGVHCEVVRSLVIGPDTALGHFVYLSDSIVGREVNLAGYVRTANTNVSPERNIRLRYGAESVDTGRKHLGALIGDRVRFGASTTLCPGCIVLSGMRFPPDIVLYGTIDARKRRLLVRRFHENWNFDREPG
jgi:NDP-sugar pyrophosphorylase family protein